MHNLPFLVLYTSLNFTIFGCYKNSMILASLNVSSFSCWVIAVKSIYLVTHNDLYFYIKNTYLKDIQLSMLYQKTLHLIISDVYRVHIRLISSF